MISTLNCPCQTKPSKENNFLEGFAKIREKCPALKEILVPDDIWDEFQETARKELDEAGHQYIVLGAYKNGYLDKVTSPIHRYLIDSGKPNKKLDNQYREALKERWMMGKGEKLLDSHRRGKSYQGKLSELFCAEWIEKQGWKIKDLEALGGKADIVATSPNGIECVIEVKSIGQEEDKFDNTVECISSGEAVSDDWSFHHGCNYLLSRAYEATKQLQEHSEARIVFIVILEISLGFIDLPLIVNRLKSHPPKFIDYTSEEWEEHLNKLKRKYPDIENDLQLIPNSIKELWIIKEEVPFEYSLETKIEF